MKKKAKYSCKHCRKGTCNKKRVCFACSTSRSAIEHNKTDVFKKTLKWKWYPCLGPCRKLLYTNQYLRICNKCRKRDGEGPESHYKVVRKY